MLEKRGISFVELLVTIAITTILTALLITAAREVRQRALRTQDQVNVAATLMDFAEWSTGNRNRLPNAGPPGESGADWFYRGRHPSVEVPLYLGQQTAWPRVLKQHFGNAYAQWHPARGVSDQDGVYNPRIQPPDIRYGNPSEYEYSLTCLVDTGAWLRDGAFGNDEILREYLRYVRRDEIRFPAAKGLLLYRPPTRGDVTSSPWLVGFADGHASYHSREELISPPRTPGMLLPPSHPPTPVHSTEGGIAGRDV